MSTGPPTSSGTGAENAKISHHNPSPAEDAGDNYSVKWHSFPAQVAAGLRSFLLSDFLADVALVAEGQSVRSHRMLLSLCSPHFKTLFEDSLINPSNVSTNTIVILNNVRFRDLKNVLEFIYKGEVSVSDDEELRGFLQTGKLLKIDGLSSVSTSNDCSNNCNSTKFPRDGYRSSSTTEPYSTASPSFSQSGNNGGSGRRGLKSCPCSPLDTRRSEPTKRSRISSCHDHNDYQPQTQQDCQFFTAQTVVPMGMMDPSTAPVVASTSSLLCHPPAQSLGETVATTTDFVVTAKCENEDSVDIDDCWENSSIPMDTDGNNGRDPLVALSPPSLRSKTVNISADPCFSTLTRDGYNESMGTETASCVGSNVWKHFTKLPEKTVALCIICGKYIKTSKQSSSSNLWCHLRTHKIYPY